MYQGQGFVTEFVTAITIFAFDYLHAMRVQILTQVENEKSASVAKRCGFDCEATLKNHRLDCLSGKPADSYVFSKIETLGLLDLKIKVAWIEK
ncbi:MAG: hypothetical protein A3F12_06015 [Gammaproteobacteria bacterium RIFCSPHIGHO2_12_FULL_38_14]|nr:MAG: hypothetical protein A3F12_06015 [Gammaproteobacteria bacterium RIFCSPHIGHO2_12_FULL_38_14]